MLLGLITMPLVAFGAPVLTIWDKADVTARAEHSIWTLSIRSFLFLMFRFVIGNQKTRMQLIVTVTGLI